MQNGRQPPQPAEVMDKVEFTLWKSMKADDLANCSAPLAVFLTETNVPRWKLVARYDVEAYDGRNGSPIVVE